MGYIIKKNFKKKSLKHIMLIEYLKTILSKNFQVIIS